MSVIGKVTTKLGSTITVALSEIGPSWKRFGGSVGEAYKDQSTKKVQRAIDNEKLFKPDVLENVTSIEITYVVSNSLTIQLPTPESGKSHDDLADRNSHVSNIKVSTYDKNMSRLQKL
jgi:hypothetical protein